MTGEPASAPRRRRNVNWCLVWAIASLLLLLGVLLLVVEIRYAMEPDIDWIRAEDDEVLGERLLEVGRGDETFYLSYLTDFEWTTVTYIPPYNDERMVLEETGITNWLGDTGWSDGHGVWFFCADGAVVVALTPGIVGSWVHYGTYTSAVRVQPFELERSLLVGGGDGRAEPDCV